MVLGFLKKRASVVHVYSDALRGVRALGVQLSSETKDYGINLYGVYLRCSIAEGGGYVVPGSRSNNQDPTRCTRSELIGDVVVGGGLQVVWRRTRLLDRLAGK